MANILDSINQSKVPVGPAATSGLGSLADADRSQDIGYASSLSPQDVKAMAQGAKPPKLNSFEKMSAFQRAAEGAAAATDAGKSREQARDVGAAQSQVVRNAPFDNASTKAIGSPVAQNIPNPQPTEEWAAAQADVDKKMAYKQSVTLGDQFGAAFDEMTGTGSLIRMMSDAWHGKRDFTPDPLFDSLEGRETWGKNMSQEDLEWVADAQSAQERLWKLNRLEETKENYKTIGAHGEGIGTIVGLTAGIADPVGWAAGMGVGKVAQLTKVGFELNLVSRGIAGALEGATGNVLTTAAMQAAGDHITSGDYFYAAGFGAAFGSAIGTMQRGVSQPSPMENVGEAAAPADSASQAAQGAAQVYADESLKFHAGLLQEAQGRLPDDATPEMIAATARDVYNERANAFYRQGVEPRPDGERVLPDFDYEALYGAPRPDPAAPQVDGEPALYGTLTKALEGQFNSPELRNIVGTRYGINADTVPDNAKRLLMQETLVRVEQNMPQFNQEKLDTLLHKWVAPIADSAMVAKFSMPQLILARAEHPVLRWLAGNALESPTQAGGPRTTWAVEHAIRERNYNSHVARFNEAYTAWRNQNGGSVVKDVLFKQKHFEQFNRLVSEARDNRAAGIFGDEHPHIKAAADAMDAGYDLLRRDQVNAKTLGSANLP